MADDFKNKLLEMSGEISREDEISSLNEDHRIISRNARLESRIHEAFSRLITDLQSFEYSLGGYSALPYGKVNPEKVIEQAKNNKYMYEKLKKIAYEKLRETKQVIDEVLCPEEYEEKEARKEVMDNEQPALEIEVGTSTDVSSGNEVESTPPPADTEKYLSKKTKMKKKKKY